MLPVSGAQKLCSVWTEFLSTQNWRAVVPRPSAACSTCERRADHGARSRRGEPKPCPTYLSPTHRRLERTRWRGTPDGGDPPAASRAIAHREAARFPVSSDGTRPPHNVISFACRCDSDTAEAAITSQPIVTIVTPVRLFRLFIRVSAPRYQAEERYLARQASCRVPSEVEHAHNICKGQGVYDVGAR
jgi:hypothetical protein